MPKKRNLFVRFKCHVLHSRSFTISKYRTGLQAKSSLIVVNKSLLGFTEARSTESLMDRCSMPQKIAPYIMDR